MNVNELAEIEPLCKNILNCLTWNLRKQKTQKIIKKKNSSNMKQYF